jgi:hypothetical protein
LFIIFSFMGTHQGDPFIELLFALTHFCVFQPSFLTFPSCLFPLLIFDIHSFNLISLIPFTFDHYDSQLALMGLIVKPHKCSVWSPFGSPLHFSPPHGFWSLPITLGF